MPMNTFSTTGNEVVNDTADLFKTNFGSKATTMTRPMTSSKTDFMKHQLLRDMKSLLSGGAV